MYRRRTQRARKFHYLLLVNKGSAKYKVSGLEPLIEAIKQKGGAFTICEGKTIVEMTTLAKGAILADEAYLKKDPDIKKRGKVTALIACGGDSTVNATAKFGIDMQIPIGVWPIGRHNNIASNLYGNAKQEKILEILTGKTYHQIDVGTAAGQTFTGVVGIGMVPELSKELDNRSLPRFGFGWNQIISKALEKTPKRELTITIDAFRFSLSPLFLSIHLMPQTFGLRFSPASNNSDRKFEAIMHFTGDAKEISQFIKQTHKGNYLFNGDIRQFRGQTIIIAGTKGMELYVDGDIIPLMTNTVEIRLSETQLQVLG